MAKRSRSGGGLTGALPVDFQDHVFSGCQREDLDFLYDACRVQRGAPIAPGPPMLLLRPAIAEWKHMISMRLYEERKAAYRKRKSSSAACVLL